MTDRSTDAEQSAFGRFFGFVVGQPAVALLLAVLLGFVGLVVAPFEWADHIPLLRNAPRFPVPVDAIPDIGDNQQIVFTEWPGRSPRDVDDQVTYPLTTALLGMPGVRTVRSSSTFGVSMVYVIFDDSVEFYWSRTRILEKLASLPEGTLPDDATPTLGPDATALGQVFWYTLEARSPDGKPTGGFDLHELRSIQDWTVRYALQSVPGVAEVASVGGHVQEYQVDVDPEAMRAYGVTLEAIGAAVRGSNQDVGARTLEINRVEYLVRGLGLVESIADLEQTVVKVHDNTPVRLSDVAHISLGPAPRRGALDDAGAEAVGGVVVVRHGENPKVVIGRVKARIRELASALPRRTLANGTETAVTVVPFYDRSTLIDETVETLSSALSQQILIAFAVVLLALRSFRSSLQVAVVLPLGVLGAFVLMRLFSVDANVMALAGIAIAIGTMVDLGIVFTENIDRRLSEAPSGNSRRSVVACAAREVAPAVLTSVLTTVVSFLPVFVLTGPEGKLFGPLAYTKTFGMVAALLVATVLIPALAVTFRSASFRGYRPKWGQRGGELHRRWFARGRRSFVLLVAFIFALGLSQIWEPLGPGAELRNAAFVGCLVVLSALAFFGIERAYPWVLRFCLRYKGAALGGPLLLTAVAPILWLGASDVLGFIPERLLRSGPGQTLTEAAPGLGQEFMPALDEGSFLYMPTTMPHASVGQSLEFLRRMDAAIAMIPEVDRAVGKLGRADSALDPAPVSMFETVVLYKPEWGIDEAGMPVRNWRPEIESPDDIWAEIVRVTDSPGLTSAPRLMPINTRITMLQTGMRAPLGIKVFGPDLPTIEGFSRQLETLLQTVPEIRSETVFADRAAGKPYIEMDIDREALARYGLGVSEVQSTIATALGGTTVSRTLEGRGRYSVRVRYLREERDSLEALASVLVTIPGDEQVPLGELVDIRYVRGPQMIRSEDTFLTNYVLFDRQPTVADGDAAEAVQSRIEEAVRRGELLVPPGVSYRIAGSYEHQLRSSRYLAFLVPLAIILVFLFLYLQFRRFSTSLIVFSSIAISVSGGFVLLWLYGREGFLNVDLLGSSLRDVFQFGPTNLSVAVWVGFIALIGIATDAAVIMGTYLRQRFVEEPPADASQIRARAAEAGQRRLRPCLMTLFTTGLALLPVIGSTGRGSDVMAPMALPLLGGVFATALALIVVPVLYAWDEEQRLRLRRVEKNEGEKEGKDEGDSRTNTGV
ncbi:MAG: efflux RND transporter permease subunit [Myxococcota bacterium]